MGGYGKGMASMGGGYPTYPSMSTGAPSMAYGKGDSRMPDPQPSYGYGAPAPSYSSAGYSQPMSDPYGARGASPYASAPSPSPYAASGPAPSPYGQAPAS